MELKLITGIISSLKIHLTRMVTQDILLQQCILDLYRTKMNMPLADVIQYL